MTDKATIKGTWLLEILDQHGNVVDSRSSHNDILRTVKGLTITSMLSAAGAGLYDSTRGPAKFVFGAGSTLVDADPPDGLVEVPYDAANVSVPDYTTDTGTVVVAGSGAAAGDIGVWHLVQTIGGSDIVLARAVVTPAIAYTANETVRFTYTVETGTS